MPVSNVTCTRSSFPTSPSFLSWRNSGGYFLVVTAFQRVKGTRYQHLFGWQDEYLSALSVHWATISWKGVNWNRVEKVWLLITQLATYPNSQYYNPNLGQKAKKDHKCSTRPELALAQRDPARFLDNGTTWGKDLTMHKNSFASTLVLW